MGDVISITDVQGNELAQYSYDEWGNTLSTSDNDIANINPLRYRGYYYDNETSYYYLQSRYYDPCICRFINADDTEIAKTWKNDKFSNNLYLYCNNDPINYSDYTAIIVQEMHKHMLTSGGADIILITNQTKIMAVIVQILSLNVYTLAVYLK